MLHVSFSAFAFEFFFFALNPCNFIVTSIFLHSMAEQGAQAATKRGLWKAGAGLWRLSNLKLPSYPARVAVEGTIGCGKSVLLDGLKASLPWIEVIPEDVQGWKNVQTVRGPVDILARFYADPKQHAYTFQNHVLLSLAGRASSHDFVVMERSQHSCLHVFCNLMYERELLSPLEFATLEGWYNFLGQQKGDNLLSRPNAVLYLDLEPSLALERIAQRGRVEEKGVDLRYLQDLKRLHENWFVRMPSYSPPDVFQLVRLDASKPKEEVLADAIGQLTCWRDAQSWGL